MSVSEGLILYTLILVVVAAIAWVNDTLWYSNHAWENTRSRLMSCRKCGNVFLLKRQQLDTRCPLCGARAADFRMPNSGGQETVFERAARLKH